MPLDDPAIDDPFASDRHEQLDHGELGAGYHEGADAALDRVARAPGGERLLGRLVEHHVGDGRSVGQLAGVVEHGRVVTTSSSLSWERG